jgi:hypothetical protein
LRLEGRLDAGTAFFSAAAREEAAERTIAARRLSFERAALGGALAGLGAGAAPGLPGGARVDLAGGDIALPRTNVARTPAPGAMALLLSGLAGLIFALNRRR